jgi:hypothetical protein
MRIFFHMATNALGHLFSAFGMAIFFAAIGGGAVLAYSYMWERVWPPTLLTEVTAGVIAVLAGYAAATSIILRAIAQTVLGAAKAVEDEAEKVVRT